MTSVEKVLIVGGGIAGLTAATSLAKQGVACDVLELHDRPVGAAITIQNRAVDALAEIGVVDSFLAEGVPLTSQTFFSYFDAAGQPVPTPPLPPRAAGGSLPQAIVIHRVPLARILREAAEKAGANVQVGLTVAELEQDSESVTTTWTDGTRHSYDLVIGADGVRSATRSMLLGHQVVPRYSGTTMFRWVVPGIPDVGPMGFYQAPGSLLVLVRLRDGSVYLATGRHYREPPGFLTRDQAHQILRENLAAFTAPIAVALVERLTEEETVIVNDYNWLLTPDPWYRGRVLLIGDAAHATTATLASGGGMAIEDAAVLGEEVAAGGSAQDILDRFQRRRFERAALVVQTSVELDLMLQRGDPIPDQNALRARAIGVLTSPY